MAKVNNRLGFFPTEFHGIIWSFTELSMKLNSSCFKQCDSVLTPCISVVKMILKDIYSVFLF